ncbi:MAG: hypothetical protein CME68_00480 [Halobacteriovoraceae bacterium]|nr:hypothetical protein [Halobacteriovoraceae bacterium]|tara:strand:- start:753 stop:1130 length:378 start_codon:yes stop_codon:yes gene_type:complete
MMTNKCSKISSSLLLISFLCFIQTTLFSKERSLPERSVVTDPSLSRRCEVLLKRRKERVRHKLKLMALSRRNLNLQKNLTPEKETLRKKLKKNHYEINLEISLLKQKIKREDEEVIRTGCPGVIL